MTYNQAILELRNVLSSHPMISEVLSETPAAWLNSESVPSFPSASYVINSGQINAGREQVYTIDVWLLDKAGVDGEFDIDITSNMQGIAYDILQALRQNSTAYSISNTVRWDAIAEKFEDYLSGVKFSFDLSAVRKYGACDTAIND